MDDVDRLLETFQGRTDVYGGDDGRAIYKPVTRDTMIRHLSGAEGFGVYPCVHTSDGLYVRWGCCDIDTGVWAEAYMLATALAGMGFHPFIERSRSKGWHVWVFCADWVPAAHMRRTLKVAYSAIGLPAKEANPKQETLGPTQLGNYVRLPYKGAWMGLSSDSRQCIMQGWDSQHDGFPMPLDVFLDQTLDGVDDSSSFQYWASKWYEPPPSVSIDHAELLADDKLAATVGRLPESLKRLWKFGPKDGLHRSEALTALAYKAAQTGKFDGNELWNILWSADQMWGKYHLRPDGDVYITQLVNRAMR